MQRYSVVHPSPAGCWRHSKQASSRHARHSALSCCQPRPPPPAALQHLGSNRPCAWRYIVTQTRTRSVCFRHVLVACRARRLTDGKVVVVKEIKTTSLSAKQKAATMDEVEVLAKLQHPNIVK